MLFYFSGEIYMGYVRNYIIGDVLACYYCLYYYNVLYFMGFDFFGMFVENVVIKYGIYFKIWIYENIENM